jgi:hypothetical protein
MEKPPISKSTGESMKVKPPVTPPGQSRNVTLEPEKTTGPSGKREDRKKPPGSARGYVAAALIALVCVTGGWYAFTRFHGAAPNIGISTVVGQGAPFGGAVFMATDDQVTDKQWQDRADAFKAFVASGPVLLDRADAAQSLTYLDKTISDAQQKAAFADQIKNKKVDMVAIGFYDDCAEDGDVVSVQSGPVNVVIPLTHSVQYVLIPVPHGQTANVFINGIKDGTAGITLGMVTPAGIVHMPRIVPGQQISFLAK